MERSLFIRVKSGEIRLSRDGCTYMKSFMVQHAGEGFDVLFSKNSQNINHSLLFCFFPFMAACLLQRSFVYVRMYVNAFLAVLRNDTQWHTIIGLLFFF